MSLMKTTAIAAVAAMAALGASGTVSTADAKHFKKHRHVLIIKPYHPAPYWHGRYIAHAAKRGCYWSPKMRTYGVWKYGVFIPCYW